MKFVLIGDGYIAKYHKQAIAHVNGELIQIYDPPKYGHQDLMSADFGVICCPSHLHTRFLQYSRFVFKHIICEKPLCLPWEPIPDDNNINIVLQFRYAPLPKTAHSVNVIMCRDEAYFNSWKGDPHKTGGVFFNLFIHYIDIAIQTGAKFSGLVTNSGKQIRLVDDIDLFQFDTQDLYNKMYEQILLGNGVKPHDLYYLHWIMNWISKEHGFGRNCLNKQVTISKELL